MKTDCSMTSKVAEFLSEELEADDARDFVHHLAECAACREEVETQRRLFRRLRSLPESDPGVHPGDIVAAAMGQAAVAHRKARGWFPVSVAAAAAVAVMGLAAWQALGPQQVVSHDPAHAPAAGGSVNRAVRWLEAQQQADGSWDVRKWGGRPEFQVALSSLSALAILNSNPSNNPAAERAAEWLIRQQGSDGMFGPKGVGRPFNQSLATLALLHVSRDRRDEALRPSVEAAVSAICRSQLPDGGWGHSGSVESNDTVTAWHVQTLEHATRNGFAQAAAALERGKSCLSRLQDGRPANAVSLLTKSGYLDMCSVYFTALQLSQQSDGESRKQLESLREQLIALQAASGADAGSWPPDATRHQVGGRLFSTSLAALTLDDSY